MAAPDYPSIANLWDRMSAIVGEGTVEDDDSACEVNDGVKSWFGVNTSSTSAISGPQATISQRPFLKATAPSGENLVAFTSSHALLGGDSTFELAAGDRTITIAFRLTSAPEFEKETIYILEGGNLFAAKDVGGVGLWSMNDDASSKIVSTLALFGNTDWHICTISTKTGTNNSVLYIDGVINNTGTSDQSSAITRWNLAQDQQGVEILGMSIYSRRLTEVEIWEVQRYYNDLGTLGLTIPAAPASAVAGIGLGIGTFPQD